MIWFLSGMCWNECLLWLSGVHADATTGTGYNDLNYALKLVIEQMNADNFFVNTWTQFFPVLPRAVINTCFDGTKVEINVADESLKSVIKSKVLRVGIQPLTAAYPLIFSRLGTSSIESSNSSYISTSLFDENGLPQNVTLNLTVSTLDGYEIVCAKEAALRLGILYGTEIEAQFVLVSTDGFFEPLVNALNNNEIDVVWSAIYVLEQRAKLMDYVCNTYSTDMVVAASNLAGPMPPDPNGPNVSLACINFFCSFQIPKPFSFVDLGNDCSNFCLMDVIADPITYNYTISTFETLRLFFQEDCRNCTEVDMAPIITLYQAPGTKKINNGTGSSGSATMLIRFWANATFSYYMFPILVCMTSLVWSYV